MGVRVREGFSPAFAVYLLAVALLPFSWLSPIRSLNERGEWSDVLVAVCAAVWLIERLRAADLPRAFRGWQIPLGAYLLLSVLAAAAAGSGYKTVLLMVELAVLAVVTADFSADPERRRTIVKVIIGSALLTALIGFAGLILFYAGVHSGLVSTDYGELQPSNVYARVQAGFENPNLLASFCIFASGLVASKSAGLGPRARRAIQTTLFLLTVVTFGRGVIGFLAALAIRRAAKLRGRARWMMPLGACLLAILTLGFLTAGYFRLSLGHPSHSSYGFPDRRLRGGSFVASARTAAHHPLLGIGPGALPGRMDGAPARAHFTPLNVAATLGIPALLALLAMLWQVRRGRRRPADVALWSAAVGIALDGLAQDVDHFRHVWVLIGLLGA